MGLGLTVRVGVRLYMLARLEVVGAEGGLVVEVRVEHDPPPQEAELDQELLPAGAPAVGGAVR